MQEAKISKEDYIGQSKSPSQNAYEKKVPDDRDMKVGRRIVTSDECKEQRKKKQKQFEKRKIDKWQQ